jgi:hypothetical protein
MPSNDNSPPDPSDQHQLWVYGPAGDWAPTQEQMIQAIIQAENYYAGGFGDQDYSIEQMIQDIAGSTDSSLTDGHCLRNCLDTLNNAQLGELLAYGEHSSWMDMSGKQFLAWREWYWQNQRLEAKSRPTMR